MASQPDNPLPTTTASPLPTPALDLHSNPDLNPNATTKTPPPHWLPLLSPRSLNFFDGTYTWDGGKGYWDDKGGEFFLDICIFCFR